MRRLRDSLSTDPGAEWVPTLGGGNDSSTLDRKLTLGQRALDAGDLTEPANANALEFFREALEIDPQNSRAMDGIRRVAEIMVDLAQRAQGSGDRDEALRLVNQVKSIQPDFPGLNQLESDISRQDEIDQLLTAADQLLGAGQLDQPNESALVSYRAVLEIDAGNQRAQDGLRQIEASLLARANSSAAGGDFDRALTLIDSAASVDGGSGEVDAARRSVIDQRDASWQEQLTTASEQVDRDRLDQAEITLASLVSSGYSGDQVDVLRQRIADGHVLRQYTAGKLFSDGPGPELVVIGRGQFTMGSPSRESGRSDNEGPQQSIEFHRPFALTRSEITVGQFRQFVEATGYTSDAEKNGQSTIYKVLSGTLKDEQGIHWRNDFQGREAKDEDPVVHVSWNDAMAFAAWMSEQTGETYRLPSEAEFEYALRGGTNSPYWWGDASPREKVENLTGERDKVGGRWEWPDPFKRYGDGHWGPAPAGDFEANPFGLHDIGGNVMEWVSDCYVASLEGAESDGSSRQTSDCEIKTLRGGSWASPPRMARSAYRSSAQSNRTTCLIGFRLAREL